MDGRIPVRAPIAECANRVEFHFVLAPDRELLRDSSDTDHRVASADTHACPQ